eukprot:CAMPEP_0174962180 /NCGR_PEP_ID=MMETSP0004_2-20121128/4646_1 /TAXON_ID=420556 /ORGANISM="Ochromonas sp., Strain CCMP1393" /LENGTH=286 /DNA_ID=CAMNT_0016210695 /DNA_START=667 /DNA_END=1530 /DNA_ORIENTATION=-
MHITLFYGFFSLSYYNPETMLDASRFIYFLACFWVFITVVNSSQPVVSVQAACRSSLLQSLACFSIVTSIPTKLLADDILSGPDAVGIDAKGLFALCPNEELSMSLLGSSCVSTQDDRPSYFMAPWTYDGKTGTAKSILLDRIVAIKGSKLVKIPGDTAVDNVERLIVVEFRNSEDNTVDDAEFYFTPNDSTIQFRSIRRGKTADFGKNRRRMESLRKSLIPAGFEEVPVLRNRKRVLFFVESPLDAFGPPTNGFDRLVDKISGDAVSERGVGAELDPANPVWENR